VQPGGGGALSQWGGARALRSGLSGIVAALLVSALVAACGSANLSNSRLGVAPSPRVAQDGEPIAKGGGNYKLGKPYQIAGRWYEPKHNPDYDRTGQASWYGSAFHGRRTANGEVFDMHALTAAHPTLPLPSYVRVTNLDNDHSVVVRVNDRGPFGHGRIIDVSRRTAEMLGFKRDGTAAVRVQYVDLAPIEGEDHNVLLASYRAPGAAPAGGEDTQPVMVAYAGERQQAIPALETLDATLIASGTPFDPYGALMAAEASAAVQPAAARAEPAQAVSMGLRSSYSATDRVSAAFDAIAALER
jgi:rare lipoprotein A